MTRIDEQFSFIKEIDKIKKVTRQTYLADGERKENDAEHSWHLALMAILLSEYANEKIDVLKTVTMVLIHDIVEIDAGDTFAYDYEGAKSQKERENKAADRIFSILPKDQAIMLRDIWNEFEERESIEARFAHALDNIQPNVLNNANGGATWIEHNVCISNILKRNECTKDGSQQLWNYTWDNMIKPNFEKGIIIDK